MSIFAPRPRQPTSCPNAKGADLPYLFSRGVHAASPRGRNTRRGRRG